jgi:hypothetical protein
MAGLRSMACNLTFRRIQNLTFTNFHKTQHIICKTHTYDAWRSTVWEVPKGGHGKEQTEEDEADAQGGGGREGRARGTCKKMMKKGEQIIMASMEAVLTGLEEPPASLG